MISSYGDQSTTKDLHIIIVLHQRCLNCSECFQEHLYVLYMQLQHQGNSEMVLLAYFLHESDPREDHQQIVLYSFCRSILALHLAG